jgi:hypothetical protein
MSQYVTDTHALCWHLTGDPKLSAKAKKIFQEADSGVHQILIPSIVLIEMVYLAEKGRISDSSLNQVLELIDISGGKMKIQASYRNIVPFLKGILFCPHYPFRHILPHLKYFCLYGDAVTSLMPDRHECLSIWKGNFANWRVLTINFCLRRPKTFLKKGFWTSKNFLLIAISAVICGHKPRA